MTEKRQVVVNLFAGPGAGKSTGAAYIFSELKLNGVNCELVREYAKDKTWEKNATVLQNQPYVFGKQYYRMHILQDVDVLVTDSPLPFCALYNRDPEIAFPLHDLIMAVFHKYDNLNYFIDRDKPYNPAGRSQTEEEARKIDEDVRSFLLDQVIPYRVVKGNEMGYEMIIGDVLRRLGLAE